MSMYIDRRAGANPIERVAQAKTYAMYRRSDNGVWYVSFSAGKTQVRLSTGLRDHDAARRLIESYRAPAPHESKEVNAFHLERMIERARGRAQRKGLPFSLNMAVVREAVTRCGGHCEVSGHPLEDAGPFRPSLDRINPALGYVPGNIRVVCLIANTAMLHYGRDAFLELAEAMCRKAGLIA